MKRQPAPSLTEDRISQVPALQVSQNLGYTYLTPAQALEVCGGRLSDVILGGVLGPQRRAIGMEGDQTVPLTGPVGGIS